MKKADMLRRKMMVSSFNLKDEMERFTSQLSFAEKFTALNPGKKKEWTKLISHAESEITGLTELTDLQGLRKAVRKAEKILAPIGAAAKKYTIHCVSHAHIDMNWMWSWPETVAVTNDTFTTMLKLMDEYPGFIFSQSQASVYRIIERYNPLMFEKIKQKIKEGRWEVTASHWVECDKNIVGGETLARHLLYTRKYMQKHFGIKPEEVNIDWSPDTFGHAITVPTYLAKGGVKYCYLHRPGTTGSKRPEAFWWKGRDGSKILVRNDMVHAYNGIIVPELSDYLLDFVRETGGRNYMYVYGAGDHGGGPTRRDLNRIIQFAEWPVFPTVKFSRAKDFFEALEAEAGKLPVLDEELNFEFTGCYTTQTLIKKANRYSENRLADAELASLLAWKAAGEDYPDERLELRWQDCLFNHFHDILPGSGVRDTRHYTMGLFQEIMAETSMIETQSLRRIASLIDTSGSRNADDTEKLPVSFYRDAFGAGAGIDASSGKISTAEQGEGRGNRPFIIFNTSTADRRETVELTVWDNPVPENPVPLKNRKFSVKTPDGRLIPAQITGDGQAWWHSYIKLAFPVDLKAMSYANYTIIETETEETPAGLSTLMPSHPCPYASFERSAKTGCLNDHVILEINPLTGGILRLHDRKSGIDVISPENQLPVLEYTVERPHAMSSWSVDFADRIAAPVIKKISYVSNGPYKIGIKVDAELNDSKFHVTYEMHKDSPQININIKVTWLENGTPEKGCPALRMPFAFSLGSAVPDYEIPFGSISRKSLNSDEEVPSLQWAKVTGSAGQGKKAGCVVLNDCKYGHALDKNVMRVTLIRSSYEPDPHPELGQHEINLALVPFGGVMKDSDAVRLGQNFNRPVKVIGTDIHKGSLPESSGFISAANNNVSISGIKKAESGDGIIVRLYETDGKESETDLVFHSPFFGKVEKAVYVDLMERETGEKCVVSRSGAVKIKVRPYGISSVKISFA